MRATRSGLRVRQVTNIDDARVLVDDVVPMMAAEPPASARALAAGVVPADEGGTRPLPARTALAGAGALVALGAAIFLIASAGPAHRGHPVQATEPLEVLSGVPQDGITLGRREAPVTLTVFAHLGTIDLRFGSVLPRLIKRYVRPGQLNIQLRTLSRDPEGLLSEESGAAMAQAVGLQDRLWQFVRVLDAQHPGSLDRLGLGRIVLQVPGVDLRRAAIDARSDRVRQAVARSDAMARRQNITRVPAVALTIGTRSHLTASFLDERTVVRLVDEAVRKASRTPAR